METSEKKVEIIASTESTLYLDSRPIYICHTVTSNIKCCVREAFILQMEFFENKKLNYQLCFLKTQNKMLKINWEV